MRRIRFGLILTLIGIGGFLATALAQEVIKLTAWTIGPDDPSITRMTNLQKAADRLNTDLEAQGADFRVELDATFDSTDWDPYLRRVLLAFQSGDAPDIVQASASLIGTWASAGFLAPLDDEIPQFEQFSDVVPALWDAVTFEGKRYGIPQDTEARPMFFNKVLLAKLGWSQEQIDSLPDRIASGEFTWDDLLATAKEAVDQGVVAAGNGYFHRPKNGPDFTMWYSAFGGQDFDPATGKLVFDREGALRYYSWLKEAVDAGVLESDRLDNSWDRFHQTITGGDDGEVLFFSGGTWNWAEWATQHVADRGGVDWLFDHFGFAPQPAWQAGGKPVTLSNPQAYMVSANSQHKDLAAQLLAYTTVPDLDAEHAVGSGHLPILTTTPSTVSNRFIKEVSYLLDFTTFVPSDADLGKWQDALFQGVSAVESGDLAPQEAVDVVVSLMQSQLGDKVDIR